MPANVMTMAYRNEVPWHGLGEAIPTNASLQEIAELAGLGYTIEELPIGSRIGGFNSEIGKKNFVQVDGYKLIYSPELNKVFQVASDRYQPVQPAKVVEFFREFCDRGEIEMETAGVLAGGAINWALGRTQNEFELAGGDKSNTYVLIVTSHDGSVRTSVLPTSIRVVCQNTLTMAFQSKKESDKMFTLKHSSRFSDAKMDKAKETVGLVVKTAEKFADSARLLAATKVSAEMTDNLIYKLTQPKLLEAIAEETNQIQNASFVNGSLLMSIVESAEINRKARDLDHNRVGKAILEAISSAPGSDLPSAEGTLWGILNGVTYYTDHITGSKDRDKALTSAWFGTRSNLKDSALELCLEVAATVN